MYVFYYSVCACMVSHEQYPMQVLFVYICVFVQFFFCWQATYDAKLVNSGAMGHVRSAGMHMFLLSTFKIVSTPSEIVD